MNSRQPSGASISNEKLSFVVIVPRFELPPPLSAIIFAPGVL